MAHLALSNQDILLEIFRHAAPDPANDDAQSDALAKFARVCKGFSDPALRLLWERLPSIFPLLYLISSFGSLEPHEGRVGESNDLRTKRYETYLLHDVPEQRCWERFCAYASRVRVLTEDFEPDPSDGPNPDSDSDGSANGAMVMGAAAPANHLDDNNQGNEYIHGFFPDEDDSEESDFDYIEDGEPRPILVAPSVWFHLGRLSKGQPLLPALRELDWTTTGPDQTELLLLAGPCLEKLHIRFRPLYRYSEGEYSSSFPLLLQSIAALAPGIREFSVSADQRNAVSAVVWEAASMKKLRRLEVDPRHRISAVAADLLRAAVVDCLDELESLTMGMIYQAPSNPQHKGWPAELRVLKTLSIADFSGVSEAYRLINASNLRSLSITHRVPLVTTSCAQLSSALAQQFRTITSLSLTFDPTGPVSYRADMNIRESLAPLFRLPNVTEFALECRGGGMPMKNEDLAAIVEGWAQLASLSIKLFPNFIVPQDPPMPYINALIDVARLGRNLKRLHLNGVWFTDDDGGLTDEDCPEERRVRNRSVEVFTLVNLFPVTEKAVRQIAHCSLLVYALFPALDTERSRLHLAREKEVREDDEVIDDSSKAVWDMVLDAVAALQEDENEDAQAGSEVTEQMD